MGAAVSAVTEDDQSAPPESGRRAVQLLSEVADRRPDSPLSAMIEISDHCNEVCVHCYQVQGQKGEMSTEEIFKILDDLAQMGVLRLTISGGEATLRPDLLDILRRARELGFLINLYTNGLTMTAELAGQLGELSLHAVEISLYSHRAQPHDFVTGVEGSFAKTTAGIRHLRAAGVFVVVKTPAMSVNEDEMDLYLAFVEGDLGAHCMVSPVALHEREDGARAHWALNPSNGLVLFGGEPAVEPKQATPRRKPRDQELRPCGAGKGVHVEPSGEMRPCTMLQVDLGDARTSLRDRSDSPLLERLTKLRWKDLHGCRDCALDSYCAHCYAQALAETGDALGPYGTACARGTHHYITERALPDAIAGETPPLGPYALGSDGGLVAIEHVVTPADDALAEAMPWVRQADFVAQSPPASAQPGELVQLRRPGRKQGTEHRLPGGLAASGRDLDQGQ